MDDILQDILEDIVFNGATPTRESIMEDYGLYDDDDIDVNELMEEISRYLDSFEDNISSAQYYLD